MPYILLILLCCLHINTAIAIEWQNFKPYIGLGAGLGTGGVLLLKDDKLPSTGATNKISGMSLSFKLGVILEEHYGIELRVTSGGHSHYGVPSNAVQANTWRTSSLSFQFNSKTLFFKAQHYFNSGIGIHALAGVSDLRYVSHLDGVLLNQRHDIRASIGAGLSYRIPDFSLIQVRNDQLTLDLEWLRYASYASEFNFFVTYHY